MYIQLQYSLRQYFVSFLFLISVSILHCNADVCSCRCCTDKFCKTEFQDSVVAPQCTSASCKSMCQSRNPKLCVDNSNSTFHQCIVSYKSTPDWSGIFDIKRLCDERDCCCPVGQMSLWSISGNKLRVQMVVVGPACNGSAFYEQTMILPMSFSLQMLFFGQLVEIQLSEDSRFIRILNPTISSCSESASRHDVQPISLGTIQSASLFLLIFLTSLRKFILWECVQRYGIFFDVA